MTDRSPPTRAAVLSTALLAALVALAPGCPEPPPTTGGGRTPPATSSAATTPAGPDASKLRLGLRAGVPKDDPSAGLRVLQVFPETPAAAAGIAIDDRIVAVAGDAVATPTELQQAFLRHAADASSLIFTLERAGETISTTVYPRGEPPPRVLARAVLAKAITALVALQEDDGLWPHFHGVADAPSSASVSALSLHALCALPPRLCARCPATLPEPTAGGPAPRCPDCGSGALRDALEQPITAATRTLTERIDATGAIRDEGTAVGLRAYATALLLSALCELRAAAFPEAIEALTALLRRSQLDGDEGYDPFDWHHGSWNYYEGATADTTRADLSLHSFCVEALAAAGVAPGDPALDRALIFVERSQNWLADGDEELDPARAAHPAGRDGGFAFSPRDGKAGAIDVTLADGTPDRVHRSYGSATADGLRCLLRTGAGAGDARAAAARAWLARQDPIDDNGGFPENAAIPWSRGIHFYYLHSLADALALAERADAEASGSPPDARAEPRAWAVAVVRALALAQRADGSFGNEETLMGEDSPTVATALAILALGDALPWLGESE